MLGTKQTGWWEDFFTGPWLDAQRQLKTSEQTRAEADFIERKLRLTRPARVLDVPCGVGRHAIDLAKRGYQVKGIDLTAAFVDDARHEAYRQGLTNVEWACQDMRAINEHEAFDGIYCFWGSFGYLDDQGNADFLQSVARSLKPGARFLLDTHVTETLLPRLSQKHDWKRVGNILMLEERSYDYTRSRSNTEWTLIRDGETFAKTTSIRLYSYRELREMLVQAGFSNFEAYGNLNDQPFGLDAARLYMVAART